MRRFRRAIERDFRAQAGFTLVELSIVCLVIGVLAGMAIPNYARSKAHVNRASCHANQRNIFAAATVYVIEHHVPDGVMNSGDLYLAGAIPSSLADCPEDRDGSHDDYDVTVQAGQVVALACRYDPVEHQWNP